MSETSTPKTPLTVAQVRAMYRPRTEEERDPHGYQKQFVTRYGVRKYDWTETNVMKFLKSAPNQTVAKQLIDLMMPKMEGYGRSTRILRNLNMFDHQELWGRDRKPLVLIGHPYSLWGESLDHLKLFQDAGCDVNVNAHSWYGFGTTHVRISLP